VIFSSIKGILWKKKKKKKKKKRFVGKKSQYNEVERGLLRSSSSMSLMPL
jgi:hypothetical protein